MIATVSSKVSAPNFFAAQEPVQVSVTWVDNGTQNGLWMINPTEVIITKKVGLIVYTLTSKSTPGAVFLSPDPVLWISPSQPDNFAADVSEEGLQLFLANTNDTKGEPQAFSFRLLVVYDGVTRISPDPTIINKEPS
jgi:hypothetical protein